MRLAFVETPEQLAHVPPDFHVVALAPHVEVALERISRPFTRPQDYLDERALEAEGIAGLARIEQLCGRLDKAIQAEIPLAAAKDLTPARFNFYWFKIVYDAFTIRCYELLRVLRAERPAEVLYFRRGAWDPLREWISQSESLYAPLLELLLPRVGIYGIQPAPVAQLSIPSPCISGRRSRFLSTQVRLALQRRRRWLLKSIRRRFFGAAKGRVLCLDYGYNIPYLIPYLERLGLEVWIWTGRDAPRPLDGPRLTELRLPTPAAVTAGELKQASSRIESDTELRRLCTWEEQDLWPVLKPRLTRLIQVCVPEVVRYFIWAEHVLSRLRPGAVLVSMVMESREKAIVSAARSHGVPTVVLSHGPFGLSHIPRHVYADVESVDWMLCWGECDADWVKKWASRPVTARVVGSPMVEEASRSAPRRSIVRRRFGLHPERRLVMYVPTAMDGNHYHLSYRKRSDSSSFSIQKRIVKVLLAHPECVTVYKEHPATVSSPMTFWLRDHDKGQVRIIRDPNVNELIHLADVVILDQPSTALIQALYSKAQIYLFNDWVKWSEPVRRALQRSLFVSSDLEMFCARLDEDLSSGRAFEPRRYDPELQKLVGASLPGKGRAAQAAASVIEEIIQESINGYAVTKSEQFLTLAGPT